MNNSQRLVSLIFFLVFCPTAIQCIFPFFITQPYYSIDEGVPFVQQNSTHWFVKTYLPDVDESDFYISVNESNLIFTWTDHKEIQYRGRVYKSSEDFEQMLEIPAEKSESDITVHWDKDIVVVTIPKPHQQIDEGTCDSISDGVLMKMKVPEDGDHSLQVNVKDNHLAVVIEASGTREHGEGENKYYSTFHNKIQRLIPIPEGVDPSDIDTQIENGELVVSLKDFPKISPQESTEA